MPWIHSEYFTGIYAYILDQAMGVVLMDITLTGSKPCSILHYMAITGAHDGLLHRNYLGMINIILAYVHTVTCIYVFSFHLQIVISDQKMCTTTR